MPLTPGVRLGPYEILEPIGAGGMGEVHRARHLKLNRDVAIKVLPTALARDPTLMINGRDDFLMPYELSEKPLFELLGPSAEQKRHARLQGGHIPTDRLAIIREVLDWLDRHLGPVDRSES